MGTQVTLLLSNGGFWLKIGRFLMVTALESKIDLQSPTLSHALSPINPLYLQMTSN